MSPEHAARLLSHLGQEEPQEIKRSEYLSVNNSIIVIIVKISNYKLENYDTSLSYKVVFMKFDLCSKMLKLKHKNHMGTSSVLNLFRM